MMKKLLSMLFAVALLFSFAATAQADYGETYYNLRFSQGYAVYTGPGTNYYRANGNAFYGGGVVRYYGTVTNGWLMIGYQTSGDMWRMGYIEPSAATKITTSPTDYQIFTHNLGSTVAYVTADTYITDDPLFGNKTPLTTLSTGQQVTVLDTYNYYWTYAEVQKSGFQPIRGFIMSSALSNYAPPLPTPTYIPQPTPMPTSLPSGAPYLSSLTNNAPNTGIMVPGNFSPSQTSYLLTVADWVSSIYFIPYSPNAQAIYFNGAPVGNGAKTPSVTLSDSPSSATFTLIGYGGQNTTYTVFIQRRPSERRTYVSSGYIESVYSKNNKNYIRADLVSVTYTAGTNLSTFENQTYYIYDYPCADNCIFYYGTMQNPIRAISFSDFISHYTMYGSTLYRIIYIEDQIVAVMPYNSDYASP